MTSISGAQIVAHALRDEGIRFTFGIPGAQNLELYDCLNNSADIQPVLVTDERSAPFIAGGLALTCGQPGCVLLVPGAGLTHALSGIAEAYMDNVPLLVLATGVRNDIDKAFQLHEIDQLALARPVSKAQIRIDQAVDLYRQIKMASAMARTPPAGPVVVEVPANLFIARQPDFDASDGIIDHTPATPALVSGTDVQQVAAAIEQSRQPFLYLGRGSADAKEDLVKLAEGLEAPVCTTFQGKSVFPEHHPLWLWPNFGPTAPPFVGGVAEDCDLTLAIGCRFSEVATGSFGAVPPGRLIRIDVDRSVIGRNYPVSIGIAGEASAFIRTLLPKLRQRPRNESLRARIREGHAQLWSKSGSDRPKQAVSPERLMTSLQKVLPNDTIYVTDSGNGLFLAAETLRLDSPQFCMDRGVACRYIKRLVEEGITERVFVLIGVAPLVSPRAALWIRQHLPGTIIPDMLIERLARATDPRIEGVRVCIELLHELAEIPGLAGVHLMGSRDSGIMADVIAAARTTRL